jgi:hypothetical protein
MALHGVGMRWAWRWHGVWQAWGMALGWRSVWASPRFPACRASYHGPVIGLAFCMEFGVLSAYICWFPLNSPSNELRLMLHKYLYEYGY